MASTFPQKQSETSQSSNKKMIHLLRAAANALRKYLHCFLKMLPISIRTSTANLKLLLSIDEQASSKIKSDKKECKISVPDEKHFYFLM